MFWSQNNMLASPPSPSSVISPDNATHIWCPDLDPRAAAAASALASKASPRGPPGARSVHGWIWAYESDREVISNIPGLSRSRAVPAGGGDGGGGGGGGGGEDISPAAAETVGPSGGTPAGAVRAASERVRRVVHDVDEHGRILVCELAPDSATAAAAAACDAGQGCARGPDGGGDYPSAEAPAMSPPATVSVLAAAGGERAAAGRPVSPCDGCSHEGRLRPPAAGPCALCSGMCASAGSPDSGGGGGKEAAQAMREEAARLRAENCALRADAAATGAEGRAKDEQIRLLTEQVGSWPGPLSPGE
jgi:hypothetical protein